MKTTGSIRAYPKSLFHPALAYESSVFEVALAPAKTGRVSTDAFCFHGSPPTFSEGVPWSQSSPASRSGEISVSMPRTARLVNAHPEQNAMPGESAETSTGVGSNTSVVVSVTCGLLFRGCKPARASASVRILARTARAVSAARWNGLRVTNLDLSRALKTRLAPEQG